MTNVVEVCYSCHRILCGEDAKETKAEKSPSAAYQRNRDLGDVVARGFRHDSRGAARTRAATWYRLLDSTDSAQSDGQETTGESFQGKPIAIYRLDPARGGMVRRLGRAC